MAKMFYTLEEAAQKLGMSADEVQALAESGQLQEFRDRDRLVFKVDQVDLLAGGDDEEIHLAESGELEPLSLSSSGSGSAFAASSPAESTGISIFDPDADDQADPSADTLVTGAVQMPDINMDSAASGSGLAQLTLEPDDTSLGANLLEDVYGDSGGSEAGESAIGGSAIAAAAGGALFESAGEPEFGAATAAQAALMPATEAYDGAWSGIAGGMALAMVVLLAACLGVMILGMAGSAAVLDSITGSAPFIVMGGAAGVVLIFAAIGWVALRKS